MAAKFKWWKERGRKAAVSLIPTVQALENDMQLEVRYTDMINEMQNRNYGGLTPGKIGTGAANIWNKTKPTRKATRQGGREPMAINTTANIGETIAARICGTEPKPRFLTVMGDYSRRRRAQQTDRGVAGIFHQQNAYEETEMAFRDSEAVGLGHCKVVEDVVSQRVAIERCVPGEVLWDEDACPNGKPRQRYQRKWVTSDELADRFPRKDKAIAKAATSAESQPVKQLIASELVYVVEGWHLPTYRGGKGRHVIAIPDAILLDEDWTDELDPLATMSFIPAYIGAQAQGLVEYLRPLQQELNAVVQRIQKAVQIGATNRIVYEDGALFDEKQLTNDPGDVVKLAAGGMPRFRTDVPQVLAGQVFQLPDWLVRMMHDSSGQSQLSASGRKPAEVESGIAMRTLQDIEQLRFALLQRRYDRFIVQIALLCVRAAARLVSRLEKITKKKDEDPKSFYVTTPNQSGNMLLQVDWSKTLKDTDDYTVQCWPTNLLPSTPGAKLATVTELMQMGMITKDIANSLLDFPDLDLAQSLYASEIDLVDSQVEDILDGKSMEDAKLRPFQSYEVVVLRASQHARQAVLDGAPEDRISELQKYIQNAADRLGEVGKTRQDLERLEVMEQQQAEQQQAEQQAQQQAAPPAAPQA